MHPFTIFKGAMRKILHLDGKTITKNSHYHGIDLHRREYNSMKQDEKKVQLAGSAGDAVNGGKTDQLHEDCVVTTVVIMSQP